MRPIEMLYYTLLLYDRIISNFTWNPFIGNIIDIFAKYMYKYIC